MPYHECLSCDSYDSQPALRLKSNCGEGRFVESLIQNAMIYAQNYTPPYLLFCAILPDWLFTYNFNCSIKIGIFLLKFLIFFCIYFHSS